MKLLLLILFFISTAYAEEWDCARTKSNGTFTLSNDCSITGGHVDVTNTLEINGTINQHLTTIDKNTELVTITAATNQRHFYVNGEKAKLTLHYVKLVGGDVDSYSISNSPDFRGGSICIYTNGGELNLYSSIVFNNKARNGG